MDYIWLDDELDYDADIYEEGANKDWEVQENQQLLMLQFSQLRGETPILSQDDNDHIGIPSERHQDVPSLELSKGENIIRDSYEGKELLNCYSFHPTKEYTEWVNKTKNRGRYKVGK
ncbi:hypothetical protein J1N35_013967 [Gossypium stocksii]|uniref:Uncharacterized protein n=1 Tax=Gossypium stocksii TaxID=47602 RepID=A0A9D3VUU6_9ROSI|nr:hypothetical protein J1N35_013967 [Gossypium stocksii]